jgi:hypothetical protein
LEQDRVLFGPFHIGGQNVRASFLRPLSNVLAMRLSENKVSRQAIDGPFQ